MIQAYYDRRRKSGPRNNVYYEQWVNEFMASPVTVAEMREGARQILIKVSRG